MTRELELEQALANLTDVFLECYGSFPLDNHKWRDVMKEAYRLIGQPNTPDRTRLTGPMQ